MSVQNDIEEIQDLLSRGKIDAGEANVQLVLASRVRVVHSLPAQVRQALNDAVKSGRLAHMKKNGYKPEVYYRPQNRPLAIKAREDAERDALAAFASVIAKD